MRAGGPVRPGRQRLDDGIHERYERELGNDLGNLLSRTTAMIARYRDGKLADAAGDAARRGDARRARATTSPTLDPFDITGALDAIWDLVRALNQYVDRPKPWELAKDEAKRGELDEVPVRPRRRPAGSRRRARRPTSRRPRRGS